MNAGWRWRYLGWSAPWLLFQAFPIADLVATSRPVAVRIGAGVLLLVFTVGYLDGLRVAFCGSGRAAAGRIALVAGIGTGLGVWLGPSFAGLMIYVAAAAAIALAERWAWPVIVGAAAVCAGVVAAHGQLGTLFILPLICLLAGFGLRGTRRLVSMNAELVEARDELARNVVAEERLRFARDLHDLLGHSLSLIALKSELAGRLAERDPVRAREEMADVEAVARRALAEVRDAVSGYRQVSFAQALVEARSALSAAQMSLRAPGGVASLPAKVDAVLGWVIREATTNVLRHSHARSVTVELTTDDRHAELTVADDGIGSSAPVGAGLSGLAERVKALGGRLESGPAGGRGFRLRADLPLAASAAPAPPAASERVPAP